MSLAQDVVEGHLISPSCTYKAPACMSEIGLMEDWVIMGSLTKSGGIYMNMKQSCTIDCLPFINTSPRPQPFSAHPSAHGVSYW